MPRYITKIERDSWSEEYMVTIRRENEELVGVPLRGVSMMDAIAAQQAISFAFDYGLNEMRQQTADLVYKNRGWVDIDTATPD